MFNILGPLVCAAIVAVSHAADDGVAVTPPRGWRSWNCFKLEVTQDLILGQVAALTKPAVVMPGSKSLLQLGFDRIGIDDGWQACGAGVGGSWHDAAGKPLVNSSIFPDLAGMNAKAAGLGVKMGFYQNNCWCNKQENAAWNATGGHPVEDAQLTADAGFLGVKIDGCGPAHNITKWYDALQATGKKGIMIENCGDNSYHWSAPLPEDIEKACPYHMYRVSKDIAPNFFSAMYNLQYTTPYQNHGSPTSKPGCWSYPDMLQIGNNMTTLESQTHYGAWCIVSSPLVLGFDLTGPVLPEVYPLLANDLATRVNQEWAGSPGFLLKNSSDYFVAETTHGAGNAVCKPHSWGCENVTFPTWQVWGKPLLNGDIAFFANVIGPAEVEEITVSFEEYPELARYMGRELGSKSYSAVDVWSRAELGEVTGSITFSSVKSHGNGFYILKPT